jgi:hypothetical protein
VLKRRNKATAQKYFLNNILPLKKQGEFIHAVSVPKNGTKNIPVFGQTLFRTSVIRTNGKTTTEM